MFLLEMASMLYVSQADRLHSFLILFGKTDYIAYKCNDSKFTP